MINRDIPSNMRFFPTVFAVGENYQIFVTLNCEAVVYIKVGEKVYYDDESGVLCSKAPVHIVNVPMIELDKEKEYTVCYRKVIKREYCGNETQEPIEKTFKFYPVASEKINIYHIADSHKLRESVIEAGKYFGEELDLLILNGDVYEGEKDDFYCLLNLASEITKGEKTVVSTRGNHEARGAFAEDYKKYNPTDNGRTYFTFKIGSIWGIVLDCGEDKPDSHHEYGNMVAFRAFKEKQTEFIKSVIEREEFNSPDIKHRLLLSHTPLNEKNEPPFNIDEDIYKEWAKMIFEGIKPELALFGHTHKIGIHLPGGKYDLYGYQNCPAVVGSEPHFETGFIGCGIILSEDKPKIFFSDENRKQIQ